MHSEWSGKAKVSSVHSRFADLPLLHFLIAIILCPHMKDCMGIGDLVSSANVEIDVF